MEEVDLSFLCLFSIHEAIFIAGSNSTTSMKRRGGRKGHVPVPGGVYQFPWKITAAGVSGGTKDRFQGTEQRPAQAALTIQGCLWCRFIKITKLQL